MGKKLPSMEEVKETRALIRKLIRRLKKYSKVEDRDFRRETFWTLEPALTDFYMTCQSMKKRSPTGAAIMMEEYEEKREKFFELLGGRANEIFGG